MCKVATFALRWFKWNGSNYESRMKGVNAGDGRSLPEQFGGALCLNVFSLPF